MLLVIDRSVRFGWKFGASGQVTENGAVDICSKSMTSDKLFIYTQTGLLELAQ